MKQATKIQPLIDKLFEIMKEQQNQQQEVEAKLDEVELKFRDAYITTAKLNLLRIKT